MPTTHALRQALDLTGMKSTKKVEGIKAQVRSQVGFWEEDEVASVGMDACFSLLRRGQPQPPERGGARGEKWKQIGRAHA